MFEPVNYKKLIEQDEEFRQFVADVMLDVMLHDNNARSLVASVYGFYQIGMTTEQVSKWIKQMNTWGPDKDNESARK